METSHLSYYLRDVHKLGNFSRVYMRQQRKLDHVRFGRNTNKIRLRLATTKGNIDFMVGKNLSKEYLQQ